MRRRQPIIQAAAKSSGPATPVLDRRLAMSGVATGHNSRHSHSEIGEALAEAAYLKYALVLE